ncbi:MAG: NnrU family protein, partial [Alphaproteobacteria bacterium]
LWAATHVPPNGDAASLILFGSLGALALSGMRLIDRRAAARLGSAWGPIALTTSAVPFRAALEGRTRIRLEEIGWWRLALGLALYVIFLLVHELVIGVPA